MTKTLNLVEPFYQTVNLVEPVGLRNGGSKTVNRGLYAVRGSIRRVTYRAVRRAGVYSTPTRRAHDESQDGMR